MKKIQYDSNILLRDKDIFDIQQKHFIQFGSLFESAVIYLYIHQNLLLKQEK